ncbi:MAG: aminoacyl-histidine dipeptidase [Lachnospiraceae bacterium]|jgi:dipeptidase D|nr:aminoacyl-histidine dipeptidase [Lachnospiraceae bacterium]
MEEKDLLENLEPKKVFHYFEEITKIPHGSGNTKAISDYCVAFAKEHGLAYWQDESNNVIIVKEASKGREKDAGVILQGHLDMVAVKAEGCEKDLENDGLDVKIDRDEIYAEGTSLGGDDGIAVAYALAILDSEEISHSRLEVILTVDEETGMCGANVIDLSMIKGKYLLNLDSEEEGILLTSCAGGLRGDIKLPIIYEQNSGVFYQISIKGLKGGHSGAEIHKERANAIKLGGRLLHTLQKICNFSIINISGGEKDNAIANYFTVDLLIEEEDTKELEVILEQMQKDWKQEYAVSDKDICIVIENKGIQTSSVFHPSVQQKMIFLLMNMPNGIQNWSMDINGLVETSLNVGILRTQKDYLELVTSIRSSVKSRKYALSEQLRYLAEFLGGEYTTFGDYPEWAYKRDSELREKMIAIYEKMFGKKPEIQAIHAGLECGLLLEKCPDLDAVSFGPNMKDIHTPKERLSISSTERVWNYLLEVLNQI